MGREAENLFSPSRLEIKEGTSTNCLGRMTALPEGAAVRRGPLAGAGGESRDYAENRQHSYRPFTFTTLYLNPGVVSRIQWGVSAGMVRTMPGSST